MNLLPKASGTRPRVACEIMPQGVVAARAELAAGPLSAVASAGLTDGAIAPSLKPGNVADRVEVAAAVRRALEQVGARSNSRNGDITLVIPDAAARVLLLDFDALPNRLTEALPLVRFRLKKLLPFDADEAMVSFQVMSTSRSVVRVLAVAIPRDVLSEYETAAREAGFEPGAVLPSTLAALAAVEGATPVLLVNANALGVTTAILRDGILLLHRSIDLQPAAAGVPANLPAALFEPSGNSVALGGGGAALTSEIGQAVSVAAAYFEDTLAMVPERVLSAGPLGAEQLRWILTAEDVAEADGLRVRELVESSALAADAATAAVPRAWLSGVLGALRG
jgi:type IV pilus assembly protein PilM